MAELDSFFAKKDKKKVKGRKYDNPDDIAKRLKESEKKLEKDLFRAEPVKKPQQAPAVDETTLAASTGSLNKPNNPVDDIPEPRSNPKQEEDEWKDFTDDPQKDMTNLKISKLQIEDEEDGIGGCGSGEDGEGGGGQGGKSDGVWNKNLDRTEADHQTIAESEIVPSSKEVEKSSLPGGSYVPPHLRNVSSSSSSSSMPKSSRKPKTAPDITSAMAFPSLSDAQTSNPMGAWGRKKQSEERGFENVKHGSTKTYSEEYAPPKLSTANRFDALSDNS